MFNNLIDAETALASINLKCRIAVSAFNPDAVDDIGIISRSASSGQLEPYQAARTISWASIQETVEGKFVFPLITGDVNPALTGVDFLSDLPTYSIKEYNPLWFLIVQQ